MDIRGEKQGEYWGNRATTYGNQYGLDRECNQLKIERKMRVVFSYVHRKLEPRIIQRPKVIEFGCGTGLYTKELSKKFRYFVSSDISYQMIEVAQKNNPDVEFKEVDARKMEFGDESFDVVFSAFLLQHAETELVLPEMYRILKKNGVFVAIVPNILNPIHYGRARVGLYRKIFHENSNSEDFTRWKWLEMMKNLGYRDIEITPIEFTSPYTPKSLTPIYFKASEILEKIPVLKEFAGSLIIAGRK